MAEVIVRVRGCNQCDGTGVITVPTSRSPLTYQYRELDCGCVTDFDLFTTWLVGIRMTATEELRLRAESAAFEKVATTLGFSGSSSEVPRTSAYHKHPL